MRQKLWLLFFALSFTLPAYAAPTLINTNSIPFTLISFFGIGILLAFTPCVLPMVPILSGILIGQEKISTFRSFQLALTFVIGMALTYALAGVAAGFLGSTLQTVLQTPWVIVSFSFIFIFMALSMFGLFELKLPSFITKRAYQASNKQSANSLIGVALMGVLSTLIASPCVTAPMVSVLTYISQSGNAILGGILLFTLALGMGLPLILFAMGQGALLPKTGAWMNKIKYVFGVMLLGVAIIMLSRIVSGEIVMLMWAGLLIVSAIAFGALDFMNEHRLIHGVSFLGLIYGISLMLGAFMGHDDLLHPLQPIATANASELAMPVKQLFIPARSFRELNAILAEAKEERKPVLIEFYAGWCPDCRALDRNVFAKENIQKLMRAFTVVRVDITTDNDELKAMRKRYNIYGVPSVVFYDKAGREIAPQDTYDLNENFFKQKLTELS